MRLMVSRFSTALLLALLLGFSSAATLAQNSNTASGQMNESKNEVGKAGKSMGRNVKHGRVVKGGKHFGKHFGKAGKHFGKGTKKAIKKVIS